MIIILAGFMPGDRFNDISVFVHAKVKKLLDESNGERCLFDAFIKVICNCCFCLKKKTTGTQSNITEITLIVGAL
jgi:hypothetical protein